MKSYDQYGTYRKPGWAPPPWLFGPVWTVLYVLIAISYGYVFYGALQGTLPIFVIVPFLLNLVFNAAYTPIQFKLKDFRLALADIFLVLGTLVWAIGAIFPYISWVSYVNLPYLAWVCFATVLQVSVTWMNRNKAS